MLVPKKRQGYIHLVFGRDELGSSVMKSTRCYLLGLKMPSFSFMSALFLDLRLCLFVWLIVIKMIMKIIHAFRDLSFI